MSEESSSVILDFKKSDIEALLTDLEIPEFCWPINDLWKVQVRALDENYCGDCYLDKLYSFVSINQRKQFAYASNIVEEFFTYIYGDEILDIFGELDDEDFCCMCERWTVLVCSNFMSSYDGSDINDYVKYIDEQIGLHIGTIPAEP
jgi:hypothetical protein